MRNLTITSIPNIMVGHAESREAMTGCTVLICPRGATVACDVRGGYPGTFDTHSIEATRTFVRKHAIFLVGGDVFGLPAAEGIQKWLVEKGLARIRSAPFLPAVVGANIYDLDFSDPEKVSYPELGYSACVNASDKPVTEGNVGAGISATVGKFLGIERCSKGGIGSSALSLSNGLQVGALVVTNAEGNIKDPETGTILAGAKSSEGKFVDLVDVADHYLNYPEENASTTIAIVATNACLSHEHLIRVTQMATAGMTRTIDPVHTSGDGDTVFGLATDSWSERSDSTHLTNIIGFLAARQLGLAIKRSVSTERLG